MISLNLKIASLFFCCLVLSGCAAMVPGQSTLVTLNPKADINQVRKVAVIPTETSPNFTYAAGMWETELIILGFKVVDRGNIETILKEQGLSLSGVLRDEDALKIGHLLGVDALFFVDRGITQSPSGWFLDYGQVHLVDVNTGRVIFTVRLGKGGSIQKPLEQAGWKYFYRKIPERAPILARLPDFDQNSVRRVAVSPNAFHELMSPLLSAGYDVIEREQLKKILEEQKLSLTGILSQEEMKKIGQIYGIQGMAFSERLSFGGLLQFYFVKLVHLETGLVVWSMTSWAEEENTETFSKHIKTILAGP